MEEIAGWVAPIATTVAAMMTASNLGPRMTGWGFAVFVIASLAWVVVAIASDQGNLLFTNGFLMLVNIVGVWRWLGREARWADKAQAAERASESAARPALFAISGIADAPIRGVQGDVLAHCVDAMAECESGRIRCLLVREGGTGGLGERIHALDWSAVRRDDGAFSTRLDQDGVRRLPEVSAAT